MSQASEQPRGETVPSGVGPVGLGTWLQSVGCLVSAVACSERGNTELPGAGSSHSLGFRHCLHLLRKQRTLNLWQVLAGPSLSKAPRPRASLLQLSRGTSFSYQCGSRQGALSWALCSSRAAHPLLGLLSAFGPLPTRCQEQPCGDSHTESRHSQTAQGRNAPIENLSSRLRFTRSKGGPCGGLSVSVCVCVVF